MVILRHRAARFCRWSGFVTLAGLALTIASMADALAQSRTGQPLTRPYIERESGSSARGRVDTSVARPGTSRPRGALDDAGGSSASSGGTGLPVSEAPPPARFETQPNPPPRLLDPVWQAGHWRRTGSRWVWQPGRYVERPDPLVSWVGARWRQGPWGWVYVPGRWTPLEAAQSDSSTVF